MLQRYIVITCALGLLSTMGCQSLALRERLDETSGATVVTQSEPRVFARSLPRYSRSGRDYLYLGPVEINRQGNRVYGLWVGLATTIDPLYMASTDYQDGVLYFELNGELMALPLVPWTEWAPGLGKRSIYDTALALRQELVAAVTVDQLALLATVNVPNVYLSAPGGKSLRFALWSRDDHDWSGFVGRARGFESGANDRAAVLRLP